MVLTFQLNDADCLTRLKNKIQIFYIWKDTLHWQRYIERNWKNGKWYTKQVETEVEYLIGITDKVDFKSKIVRRNKEIYYVLIKRIHQEGIKYWCTQFHKTNTIRHEKIDSNAVIADHFNTLFI
jgi:hypothetical protein